jgi:nucleotide-binding universal stress UspA family protein
MYHKIMVPLDGSELAECVLPHVESMVRGQHATSVSLIRVVEPTYMPQRYSEYGISEEAIKQAEGESRASAQDYLEQLAKRLDYGRAEVPTMVLTGKVAETLADYAAKYEIDLVVISTHGRSGINRWVWGSIADRLLRSICAPVLMVRAPGCGLAS